MQSLQYLTCISNGDTAVYVSNILCDMSSCLNLTWNDVSYISSTEFNMTLFRFRSPWLHDNMTCCSSSLLAGTKPVCHGTSVAADHLVLSGSWSPCETGHTVSGQLFHKGFVSSSPRSRTNMCRLMWKIMIRSCHNFAHAMTAQLSWHVQNSGMIGSSASN